MESSDSDIVEKPEPTEQRERVDYWIRWLKAAKKAAKHHIDATKEAWAEYDKSSLYDPTITSDRKADEDRPVYPIYWSSCKTLEPALYGRSPKTVAKRRFDIDDPIATTASMISERFGEYLIENGHFDDAMYAAVQDFLHGDKTNTQLVYEYDTELVTESVPLVQAGETWAFSDGVGELQGEPRIAEDGVTVLGDRQVEKQVNKRIRLAPLCYNEILHTPEAKTEAEIVEKAYFFSLSKEDAEKKFQFAKGFPVPWKTNKSYNDDDNRDDRPEGPGKYLEGWEIWCKSTKKVYWVCEDYPIDFLKPSEEDPYSLVGFFPSTPFIISSKPSKSLFPTPVWLQLRPTARQLNLQYNRVFQLVRAVRRRALIDGSAPEIVNLATELESGEFITVRNLSSLLEKGGLQNMIAYMPVQELVTAISELNQLTDIFKSNFYEWFGVPDIMRAVSDPVESLGAQELKQGNANDRFKKTRKMIQDLARNSVEMMLDLALKVYDDEEIFEICGGQYFPPEHAQNFAPALQLLKDDRTRIVRIEIETDSTNFIDEQWAQQNRNTVSNTLIGGLQSIGQMSQTNPQFVGPALRALLSTLAGITGGKEFEEGVKAAVQGILDQINNPPPAQPPPPDPAMLKLEIERENNQIKREELMLKAKQLELEGERLRNQTVIESLEAQLKAQKIDAERELETVWQQIEQLKIALDQKAKNDDRQQQMMESRQQPVMINLGANQQPTTRTKIVTPVRDADGNMVSAKIEEIVQ